VTNCTSLCLITQLNISEMANKMQLLFRGKEKDIFSTDEPDKVLIHFKDVTTAFGGIKKALLRGKGVCNNKISAIVLKRLSEAGIPCHFICEVNDREQLCRKVELIPLQVVVRNRLAGTTATLLGLEDGTRIPNVVYELRYNNDTLGDPMINRHHAVALGLVTYEEVDRILGIAAQANTVLKELFLQVGIELIDFKIECGKSSDGEIILADEISPDNSRLWDIRTGEVLDKDRFRRDMSDVCASYREVMERLVKLEGR